MRRRNLLATAVLVAALVAGSSLPARAAAEWTDPVGDANGVAQDVNSSPRPSDPQLDVVAATISVVGDSLVAKARTSAGGNAQGSFGSLYRFYFTFKGEEYYFLARTATPEYAMLYLATPGFFKVGDEVNGDTTLKCDCKAAFDDKAKQATFTIKLAPMKSTLKASGGATLSALRVQTLRRYPVFVNGDVAPAPEKLTLTI
jgi:hypothetical protein